MSWYVATNWDAAMGFVRNRTFRDGSGQIAYVARRLFVRMPSGTGWVPRAAALKTHGTAPPVFSREEQIRRGSVDLEDFDLVLGRRLVLYGRSIRRGDLGRDPAVEVRPQLANVLPVDLPAGSFPGVLDPRSANYGAEELPDGSTVGVQFLRQFLGGERFRHVYHLLSVVRGLI